MIINFKENKKGAMNKITAFLKGCVKTAPSSFCLILLALRSPSVGMELKVSKEITCRW